jgi:hypothetical protein
MQHRSNIERKEGSNSHSNWTIASLIVFAVIAALFLEPARQLLGY